MTTQDYIDAFNQGSLPISNVQPFIEQLLLEREKITVANEAFEQLKLPRFGGLTYKDVLHQKEFYNGHGQLETPSISFEDAFGLIKQLELHADETSNKWCDVFSLKLYKEAEGKYSGTIYQETSSPIMWLSIEDVVINGY
jgi:hypothetical protein